MTQTTNIGLKKIDGSENWRQIFDYHNDSADKTDSSVAAVQNGLAIVANGNTHAAVAEGQFVYVRNHSTLAEGLYKASSSIGTNGELTTSNLTADGSGGLNDLQEQVTSLNSNFNSLIKTNNVNAMSDENSTIDLQLDYTVYVISVYTPSMSNVACIPYLHNNAWRARLINATTGSALSQLNRTVVIKYI